MKEKSEKFKRMRLGAVGGFIFFFFFACLGRLYYLQVVQHDRYASYSKSQYFQKVQINQTRGKIFDRNMTPLAITVPVHSAFAHPSKVEDKQTTAKVLAEVMGVDEANAYDKVNSNRNFVWLSRQMEDKEYESLEAKNLAGVSFLTEDKRFYPHRSLAARIIGFCGIDNQGLAGLEYTYEDMLAGEKAVFVAQRDALGRIYGYADGRDPNDRRELVTTIDSQIQYAAEKAVKFAFEHYQAKKAVALVMATDTGEILAAAEQPAFDPNNYGAYGFERQRSISVTDSFEPGSTFKVFLAASALDAGVVTPETVFDCENGRLRIGDKVIEEAKGHKYGHMSLTEIIQKSSNIGAIKVARKLGERNFYNYLRRMGFGQKTGVDLPGEQAGLFKHFREWSAMSLPSISFGQEITATPMQIVTALSVIGNGGMQVQPHLLKAVIRNGSVIQQFEPMPPRRIISEEASAKTIEMMRYAVADGTGHMAFVKGYEMAGKTGTAQKYDVTKQKYSDDKFVASFMALFPASDPVVSILVIVDEPDGKGWGGVVAAPIVKDIAITTARMLGIPSSDDVRYEVDWAKLERKYLGKRKQDAGLKLGQLAPKKADAFEGKI